MFNRKIIVETFLDKMAFQWKGFPFIFQSTSDGFKAGLGEYSFLYLTLNLTPTTISEAINGALLNIQLEQI